MRPPRPPVRSLALLSLFLLAALACSSPEERFAQHLERAASYEEEGNAEDALIELQSALKIDPNDPGVNLRLAELLKSRGSVQAAAFHFGETFRLDPSNVEPAVEQALLLWRSAPRRATQIITSAKQRFPGDARVLRGEATIASARNDLDAALAAAQQAVEIAPEEPESWATLGAVYIQRTRDQAKRGVGDPAEFQAGVEAFEKLDALSDGHVGAQVERARLLGRSGQHEEALAGFRSAIALAKEHGEPGVVVFAAQRLAGYAGKQNDAALEIEALRAIVEATPDAARQWDALARAVERTEGAEAAEAVFQELLAAQPELPTAHVAYANFLARKGRELDAIAHLDRAIAGGLDAPQLWEQLVRLELASRRTADARATVAEMRKRLGEHDATRRAEARLAIRENRHAEAAEILQHFAGDKESAETERLRALAERGLGNLEAASSAAERAASLAPRNDAAALRLQADIQAELGNWQLVLDTVGQLRQRKHPITLKERVLEAQAHYGLGNDAQGRAILEEVLARRRPPAAAAVEFARREADDPGEVRKHLAKALQLNPGHHPTLEAMTRLDLAQGREAAALQRLDQLVESQIAGPRVLLLRSQVLLRQGQLDRAEADALRAFEAIPELTEAVDMLFTIYSAQGRIAEARRSFEEADKIGVLHKGARVLLARLQMAEGATDEARALYEKVLAEDPGMTAAKHDLARLLANDEQDLDRALALVEEARQEEPDDPAIADTAGYVYFLKGRHDVALQRFRTSLELASALDLSPPAVHYHLGLTLAELGRTREAASAFEKALSIDPGFQGSEDARERLEAMRKGDTGNS